MAADATDTTVAGALALKEWGAVARALLEGRQTVLLRKGGIHEKAFEVARDRFVVFPTVAHSHHERVRPEHRRMLQLGASDVDESTATFTVRCGVTLVAVVPVVRPAGLAALDHLHIWTGQHVQERLAFRPRHPLQVLVVRAVELPAPVWLPRLDAYHGCSSWVDLPLRWDGRAGRQAHPERRLAADAADVRAAVG